MLYLGCVIHPCHLICLALVTLKFVLSGSSFLFFFLSSFTLVFSPFGKRFLRSLLEFCRSRCCPGFECDGDLPGLVWSMYQDVSFTMLVFSPRNSSRHGHRHPHYQEAYDLLDQNRSVHQFCRRCVDPACIVNATMLKLICILLHYFDQVSFQSIFLILYYIFSSSVHMVRR